MLPEAGKSFAKRYLERGPRLAEVLFGLLMTLTFTLAAGILLRNGGRTGSRQLLIAAIACSVAWGLIAGALQVTYELLERTRRLRLATTIKKTADMDASIALVAGEMDEVLGPVLSMDERESLYRRVVNYLQTAQLPGGAVRRTDLLGAIASFALVCLSSLPAAAPFLLIDAPRLALRVSNAVLLALLYFCAYGWASHVGARPGLTGGIFLAVGIALVAVAIALGG